ncbi:MAG: energy transducer TonB [Proteobacteria bacterium]|nr:MAG: energy transducer TonB [Pseudomonadota bacterium]
MQTMIRSTLSGFLGFIVAIGLFLLMLSFLTPAEFKPSHANTNIAFNFVKDIPDIKIPDRTEPPKPPEKQEVSQPPAMPTIDVANNDSDVARIPPGKVDIKGIELYKDYSHTGLGNDMGVVSHQNGGLKSGFAPMYPQKAMRSQAEGWVEVLINVDITGRVSGISILGAEPRGMFEQAAKKAVYKWTFHPKTVDGKIVPYQVVQKIEFTLDQ